jgi:hypothetical protein
MILMPVNDGHFPAYTGYGAIIDLPKPFVPDAIEGWQDYLSPLLNASLTKVSGESIVRP